MQKKLLATPALTALIALPIAGYTTFYLMQEQPFNFGGSQVTDGPVVRQDATSAEPAKEKKADAESDRDVLTELQVLPESAPKARKRPQTTRPKLSCRPMSAVSWRRRLPKRHAVASARSPERPRLRR